MADNVKIVVMKIEGDGSESRQNLTVTAKIEASSQNFELQIRVQNTGNPQLALDVARQKLLDLGNGIVKALDHPLVM
jgi:hypothetical protein